jgi:hypothetical protein
MPKISSVENLEIFENKVLCCWTASQISRGSVEESAEVWADAGISTIVLSKANKPAPLRGANGALETSTTWW